MISCKIELAVIRQLTLFELVFVNFASIRAVLVLTEIVEKFLNVHQSTHNFR